MSYSLILLSAGKGIRVGKSIPKQYLQLAGKPMIMHTLERVDCIDEIKEIIIVCTDEYTSTIADYLVKYNIRKNVRLVSGGETRQESVYKGLVNCESENIIIHEAARPFVSVEDFEKLINSMHDNVSFVYSIPYTVLKKNEKDYISDVLNRDELVNIQLPQKFVRKDLLFCHEKAIEENKLFTEDAGMLKYYTNKQIYCLKGQPYNIKITEYVDLLYGETLHREFFGRGI